MNQYINAHMRFIDRAINDFDKALRVVSGIGAATRPSPALDIENAIDNAASDVVDDALLDASAKRRSAGLMRVNHVGEVCAQALYDAQGRFSQREATRLQCAVAGREEADHLAWTAQRLEQLGSHISFFNPLWYGAAYACGAVAAGLGDARNLGFIVETERQVEAHLRSHLERLPLHDTQSRAIVEQMRLDEIEHGDAAQALGAAAMPLPLRLAMRAASKVMTSVAYYI